MWRANNYIFAFALTICHDIEVEIILVKVPVQSVSWTCSNLKSSAILLGSKVWGLKYWSCPLNDLESQCQERFKGRHWIPHSKPYNFFLVIIASPLSSYWDSRGGATLFKQLVYYIVSFRLRTCKEFTESFLSPANNTFCQILLNYDIQEEYCY